MNLYFDTSEKWSMADRMTFRRERYFRLRRYAEQVKNGQVASVTGEETSDNLLTLEAVMADYGPLTSTPPKTIKRYLPPSRFKVKEPVSPLISEMRE